MTHREPLATAQPPLPCVERKNPVTPSHFTFTALFYYLKGLPQYKLQKGMWHKRLNAVNLEIILEAIKKVDQEKINRILIYRVRNK